MRTLTLLAAILLVALQAHAELLPVRADEAVDRQLPEARDQEAGVHMTEEERTALQPLGRKEGASCHCRRFWCLPGESRFGRCVLSTVRCCR